jgi:putative N6-adenine-specific DNA methylase
VSDVLEQTGSFFADMLDRRAQVRLTCALHVADLLAREVEALGFAVEAIEPTSVRLRATLRDCLRLNLELRTAQTVLYPIKHFRCPSPKALYTHAASFAWETLLDPTGYLTVTSNVDNPKIRNTMFANVKLKDAIVDRLTSKYGARPDSGPERRGVVIDLYWKEDHAWIHLNMSGTKLADRGYRKLPHDAPLRETLAAGILLHMGYDGSQALVNPMCGSGTLAIEAALIATDRAPGLLRLGFGFEHLRGYDRSVFDEIRTQVRKRGRKTTAAPIIASDIDPRAVEAARRNAQTAGVEHLIDFRVCDFADTPLPEEPGLIVMNPEYGKRLGDAEALAPIYGRIGDYLKQRCVGWRGYVLTANLELAKRVGLRADERTVFHNGSLECRLLRYDIYAGSSPD